MVTGRRALRRRYPATYAVVGGFAAVLGFPFAWMLVTSFKTTKDLYAPDHVPFLFSTPPTLEHVRHLIVDTPYLRWCWNTMFVGLVVVAVTLVLAVPAGYALARRAGRGVRRLGVALFLSYLVPPTVLFLPLVRVVSSLGLHDSVWSLILVYPSFTVPAAAWLLMGFFRALPPELEEAALIDGCSTWSALARVIVPASRPALVAVGILTFALTTNEFTYALTFVTDQAGRTLAVGVSSELVRGDIAYWGSLMAGALIPSVLIGLAYAVCVQYVLARSAAST